ncbi:MAG: hypothetical protein IK143_03610 [Bacteroidales bacterium]|nr:hypothetical protein [Bacteroidales bacterium]
MPELLCYYGLCCNSVSASSVARISYTARICNSLNGLFYNLGFLGLVATCNCSYHESYNCERHKYLFHCKYI